MRRRQETVLPLRRSIDQNSGFTTPRRYLAACYAQLDKDEEAEEQVSKILELEPLQPQAVKGLREPVRAYRAKGVLATSRSEAAPLLATLLSLPGDRYPPLSMTPQRQKLETIVVLVAQLEGLSRQQPVLVLTEDVHWIDPSTLETFDAVVERSQTLPVLVVMTHRPEFESPWGRFRHVTHHSLSRLNRGDGRVLSEQVTGVRRRGYLYLQARPRAGRGLRKPARK